MIFPTSLLNADDDWMESFRRYTYPKLHPYLERVGLYSVGTVGWNQYVGTFEDGEEYIEEQLEALSSERNPLACLKSLRDGRTSEGSWVLLHEDAPDLIAEGMQLHLTLFEREDDKQGRELYAHYEDDWRVSPLAHLREKNFQPEVGSEKAREIIKWSTLSFEGDE